MNRPKDRHLLIFAKAPRRGAVKRRLAQDIGDGAALQFYRRCLVAIARRLAADPRWTTWIAGTPDQATRNIRAFGTDVPVRPQGHGDLGARMRRALGPARPGGPGATTLIIGSDIPDIANQHVWAAFEAARQYHLVVGPSGDGGYWLIGQRGRLALMPRSLADVRWSTCHARSDTLDGLRRDRNIWLGETLDDVDDGPAYAGWAQRTTQC